MVKETMNCMICNHLRWNRLWSVCDRMYPLKGKFFLYQCTFCGFIRLHPKLSQNQLRTYYPSNYYSYESNKDVGIFWRLRTYLILHSVRSNAFSFILRVLFPIPAIPTYIKNGKILDVGCGAGDTLQLLHQIGWKTYGLEVDRKAVAIANKRKLTDVTYGTYKDVRKYPDNYFDVVRLYHVMEHLDDSNVCLALIYKKLKKNGQLIIGTPNVDSLIAKLGKTYWYNLDAPRHLFLFSPHTLSMIFKKHSFKIEKMTFSSGGGIVGTLQYWLLEKIGLKKNFIDNQFLIALFYPFERILDWCKLGDVFVIFARK